MISGVFVDRPRLAIVISILMTLAVIAGGLKQGETVILEGLQRARPGMPVAPAPVAPAPASPGAPLKVGER